MEQVNVSGRSKGEAVLPASASNAITWHRGKKKSPCSTGGYSAPRLWKRPIIYDRSSECSPLSDWPARVLGKFQILGLLVCFLTHLFHRKKKKYITLEELCSVERIYSLTLPSHKSFTNHDNLILVRFKPNLFGYITGDGITTPGTYEQPAKLDPPFFFSIHDTIFFYCIRELTPGWEPIRVVIVWDLCHQTGGFRIN